MKNPIKNLIKKARTMDNNLVGLTKMKETERVFRFSQLSFKSTRASGLLAD